MSRIAASKHSHFNVTGPKGRSTHCLRPHGFEKLVEGSTAEEIERLSARPVLLVGPEVATDPQAEVNIGRILFATDFSPEASRSMEYACALATAYTAHPVVLHVVDNPFDEPLATKMLGEAFCRLQMVENKWPEHQLGVEPEYLVEFGSPEPLTLDTLAKRDVQLLVLTAAGTGRPWFKPRLPGPLAYNIVTHARCPVLAIRAEKSVR
jgi:nucleotide-binding universal stress UspA family protein